MRKLAIAMALASTVLATPAIARDRSFYAGLEGGVMIVEDMDFDYSDNTPFDLKDAFGTRHKVGMDIDVIAGYDFGMVRVEGELAYKRARVHEIVANAQLSGAGPGDNYDASGRASVTSGMINALIDVGNEDALSGYAGVGVGLAKLRYRADSQTTIGAGPDDLFLSMSDSDSGIAWQGILGLRYAIGANIDLGMKYRYFSMPNVKFGGDRDTALPGVIDFSAKSRFRSHSLLASLIYNFWAPPAASAATAASSAASAASCDADVPGWFGDPGNGCVPGSAAAAAAASS